MRKTALITGASRGIGKAIAKKLAENNYDLILTCIKSIENLADYANELEKTYGIKCRPFQTDASDYVQVCQLFEQISHIDLLVNNSGISYIGLLSEMSVEQWDNVLRNNLSSSFYTSKLSIPLMLKQHSGAIINISSVWGEVGASMESAYSASKGGLNAFTKSLAKELAPSNIQVNAIACGLIDTEMNSFFSKEELEEICMDIPADRMGTVDEVATLVLKISEAPSYMTGQIITLDGGWC